MNVRLILAKASTGGQRIRAYAFESKDPPPELQLWNVGENPTDYGVHIWSQRSAEQVMDRYNERGNPLLIDVEHNGATLDGEPALTGGYARLEIRDGAPWLVFDWSSYALEQIASRQRLFLSPEYDIDPNTNEILKLYRVSLVADPGTYRARVLASAANTKETNMDPTLAAIMAVLSTVEDPAAAVAAVKDLVANMATDAPADPVSEPTGDPQPAFAASDDKPADEKKVAAKADEPKPVATAAPIAAAAPTTTVVNVTTDPELMKLVKAEAKKVEDISRDMLLDKDGHRLQPSIRTWARAQPLAVVRGLLAAAPEQSAPPARISATRGADHGTGVVHKGLEGRDLEEMQRAFGTFKASTPNEPFTNDRGEFVLPTLTPTEHRRIQAAAAAKGVK
jgi:hypothetical protein